MLGSDVPSGNARPKDRRFLLTMIGMLAAALLALIALVSFSDFPVGHVDDATATPSEPRG